MKKLQWKSRTYDTISQQNDSQSLAFEAHFSDDEIEEKMAEMQADPDLYDVRIVE